MQLRQTDDFQFRPRILDDYEMGHFRNEIMNAINWITQILNWNFGDAGKENTKKNADKYLK